MYLNLKLKQSYDCVYDLHIYIYHFILLETMLGGEGRKHDFFPGPPINSLL